MYPFLAEVLFETWAAQYDRTPQELTLRSPERLDLYSRLIAVERPHVLPPLVPETFRGPKWGQR
ncbi:hypothetical protein AQJ23_44920 [Streptomyces antibioticus]|nr:hypothetical protein [Streptomyces antibioticus]KUN16540.1 hypothetical protein AQJ23_44920 [Streptomyces antibioticus]